MSTESGAKTKQAERPGPGPVGPRGGGPMGMGMPAAKSLHFKESGLRLLRQLKPELWPLLAAVVLVIGSVALAVVGPKLLGNATNEVFTGFIGSRLPAGATKAQVIQGMRAAGDNQSADMLASMDVTPGEGVDFSVVGTILAGVLLVYLGSALLGYAQGLITTGLVQRSVYRMRRDIEEKFACLPLSYFDRQSRGEILSRVTNDVDNIAQTLQQTLSQLLNA
ncbi:MAG: ABC transporter ATP-binding protein, partial [Propionibacteriaceae bacterium]|nr:ABC transporter ATP-binding protein [Propionibacteriaceae bacterium]